MLDLKKQSAIKYILFSALYFSEGIQLAITTVIVPIYLLEKQFSPALTTLIAGSVMIPWALKFIFGFIVDSFPNIDRKTFTIVGGSFSAIGLIVLGFLTYSFNLAVFIIMLLFAQCGIGFLDVSIDAWAIESTQKKERGKINGTMMAGFFSGLAISTSLLSFIAEHNGYELAFITAGIMILMIMILPLLTKKTKLKTRTKKLTSLITKEFKKTKTKQIAILLPIISINSGIITLATPIFMNLELMLTIAQIGLITTVFTVSRIIGSISLGTLSDHINREKTLYFIVIATILSTAFLIFGNSWALLTFFYAINGFLNGGLFSVLLASAMDITNAKLGAFQFSILISLMNAGELSGELLSGSLISLVGFTKLFLFASWILGPSLLLLFIMIKTRNH